MSIDKIPYFISAGEPSGDMLGFDLIVRLKRSFPEGQAYGICGSNMREAGGIALADISELTVMGFSDVLKNVAAIKMLETTLLQQIERLQPKFAILIDYPGFHLRLAEQLTLRGIRVYQYVAPQLWAWGEGRTRYLKKVTHRVLGIMPFEEQFFKERGVNYTYVGTPQVDRTRNLKRDRQTFGLPADLKLFGFFPGSRKSEVQRILPAMMEIQHAIAKLEPKAHFLISVAPSVDLDVFKELLVGDIHNADVAEEKIKTLGQYHFFDEKISLIRGRSLDLMSVSQAALVTSGTATLECALAGTPMAVAYIASDFNFYLAKRLVKLPYISLVNLVAGEKIINEYIQNFSPHDVALEMLAMVNDDDYRENLKQKLSKLHAKLQGEPGTHASEVIAAEYR